MARRRDYLSGDSTLRLSEPSDDSASLRNIFKLLRAIAERRWLRKDLYAVGDCTCVCTPMHLLVCL
jgi:hypothetical protein